MNHIVALSGGKDSTAMALRLAEVEPRDYTYICNPTRNESPEMTAHWAALTQLLGKPLIEVSNGTLMSWIAEFKALPNWRQRWCTRLLKIEPTIAYLRAHSPALLYVGLRADEDTREGIYSDEVESDFPLRRWGWGIGDVKSYLKALGVSIPKRTDCEWCYGQRIEEWKRLYWKRRESFERARVLENVTGHTFRSPGRDTWPARLTDLGKEFERGRYVRGENLQPSLFEEDDEYTGCRVCRL